MASEQSPQLIATGQQVIAEPTPPISLAVAGISQIAPSDVPKTAGSLPRKAKTRSSRMSEGPAIRTPRPWSPSDVSLSDYLGLQEEKASIKNKDSIRRAVPTDYPISAEKRPKSVSIATPSQSENRLSKSGTILLQGGRPATTSEVGETNSNPLGGRYYDYFVPIPGVSRPPSRTSTVSRKERTVSQTLNHEYGLQTVSHDDGFVSALSNISSLHLGEAGSSTNHSSVHTPLGNVNRDLFGAIRTPEDGDKSTGLSEPGSPMRPADNGPGASEQLSLQDSDINGSKNNLFFTEPDTVDGAKYVKGSVSQVKSPLPYKIEAGKIHLLVTPVEEEEDEDAKFPAGDKCALGRVNAHRSMPMLERSEVEDIVHMQRLASPLGKGAHAPSGIIREYQVESPSFRNPTNLQTRVDKIMSRYAARKEKNNNVFAEIPQKQVKLREKKYAPSIEKVVTSRLHHHSTTNPRLYVDGLQLQDLVRPGSPPKKIRRRKDRRRSRKASMSSKMTVNFVVERDTLLRELESALGPSTPLTSRSPSRSPSPPVSPGPGQRHVDFDFSGNFEAIAEDSAGDIEEIQNTPM